MLDLRTKPSVHDGIVVDERSGRTEFVVYEPGNGTRYRLMITDLGEFGSRSRSILGLPPTGMRSGFVVCFPDSPYRTLTYMDGSFLAPSWVQEKVGCSLSDAVVLAELLAHMTDCQADSCETFERSYRMVVET